MAEQENNSYEYSVRDFSPVDKQIAEIARREGEITNKLKQENLRKLAISSTIFAGALSAIIIAIGIAIWLIKYKKIEEKIVEKVIEVPKIIEVPAKNNRDNNSNNVSNYNPSNQPLNDNQREGLNNQVKKRLASPIGKDLNFALIWDNYNDVDLHVKTPNGTFINFQRKNYAGGHLDVDKNVASNVKVPNPIENIRWDRNAPKGKYEVYANLYSVDPRNRGQDTNLKFVLYDDEQEVTSFQNVFKGNQPTKKTVKLFDYFHN